MSCVVTSDSYLSLFHSLFSVSCIPLSLSLNQELPTAYFSFFKAFSLYFISSFRNNESWLPNLPKDGSQWGEFSASGSNHLVWTYSYSETENNAMFHCLLISEKKLISSSEVILEISWQSKYILPLPLEDAYQWTSGILTLTLTTFPLAAVGFFKESMDESESSSLL